MRKPAPLILLFLLFSWLGSCSMEREGIVISNIHIEKFVYEGFSGDLHVTVLRDPERIFDNSNAVFTTSEKGTFPLTLENIVWRYREEDEESREFWLAAVADENSSGKLEDIDLFMPMLKVNLIPDGTLTLEKAEFRKTSYDSGGSLASGCFNWTGTDSGRVHLENHLPREVTAEKPLGFRFNGTGSMDTTAFDAVADNNLYFNVYSSQVTGVYVKPAGSWFSLYGLAFYDADNAPTNFGGASGEFSADPNGGIEFDEPNKTFSFTLDKVWP